MAVNYKEAAFRHFKAGSCVQRENHIPVASHLYGISAECALKAILQAARLFSLNAQGSPIPATAYPPRMNPYLKHIDIIWDHSVTHLSGRTYGKYNPGRPNLFSSFNINHRYEEDSFPVTMNDHETGVLQSISILQTAIVDGVVL